MRITSAWPNTKCITRLGYLKAWSLREWAQITKSPVFNLVLVLLDDLRTIGMLDILHLFLQILSPPFSILLCAPRGRPRWTASPGLSSTLDSSWVWSMRSTGRRLKDGKRENGFFFPWLPYFLGTIDWMFVPPPIKNIHKLKPNH